MIETTAPRIMDSGNFTATAFSAVDQIVNPHAASTPANPFEDQSPVRVQIPAQPQGPGTSPVNAEGAEAILAVAASELIDPPPQEEQKKEKKKVFPIKLCMATWHKFSKGTLHQPNPELYSEDLQKGMIGYFGMEPNASLDEVMSTLKADKAAMERLFYSRTSTKKDAPLITEVDGFQKWANYYGLEKPEKAEKPEPKSSNKTAEYDQEAANFVKAMKCGAGHEFTSEEPTDFVKRVQNMTRHALDLYEASLKPTGKRARPMALLMGLTGIDYNNAKRLCLPPPKPKKKDATSQGAPAEDADNTVLVD